MTTPFIENLLSEIANIQRHIDGTDIARPGEEVVGSAPNGAVRVRLREDNVFTDVEIDPAVVDPRTKSKLEGFVLSALSDAETRLEEQRRVRIGAAIQALIDDCLAPSAPGGPVRAD